MDHNDAAVSKVTVPWILERKLRGEKIACLTAYDYPTARLVDEAGIDMILVGDSLGQVVLGYESTVPVTVEEILHHLRAVRRGTRRALLIADLPYGAYHVSEEKALEVAIRYVKEGGTEAVKLEGGKKRAPLIRRLLDAEIPVMAHIGLTPQSLNTMGGYRVQGKTLEVSDRTAGGSRSGRRSRRVCHCSRRDTPRIGSHRDPAAANPHHRHWRRPRLRRTDTYISRSDRFVFPPAHEVRPPVR